MHRWPWWDGMGRTSAWEWSLNCNYTEPILWSFSDHIPCKKGSLFRLLPKFVAKTEFDTIKDDKEGITVYARCKCSNSMPTQLWIVAHVYMQQGILFDPDAVNDEKPSFKMWLVNILYSIRYANNIYANSSNLLCHNQINHHRSYKLSL
jgi:hypothetical protein